MSATFSWATNSSATGRLPLSLLAAARYSLAASFFFRHKVDVAGLLFNEQCFRVVRAVRVEQADGLDAFRRKLLFNGLRESRVRGTE